MASSPPVLILGAGELAQEIRERVKECGPYDFQGFLQTLDPESGVGTLDGNPVHSLRSLDDLSRDHRIIIGFGGSRRKAVERVEEMGFPLETVVHPAIIRDATAQFGPGCFCFPGGNFSSFVKLGKSVMATTNVNLGHHVRVGDYATLTQGAGIGGGAVIEREAFVGMAAVILDHKRVGEGAVVAAGAVVTRDVAPRTMVAGVPARVVRENIERS